MSTHGKRGAGRRDGCVATERSVAQQPGGRTAVCDAPEAPAPAGQTRGPAADDGDVVDLICQFLCSVLSWSSTNG
jgi:hypothetical protein